MQLHAGEQPNDVGANRVEWIKGASISRRLICVTRLCTLESVEMTMMNAQAMTKPKRCNGPLLNGQFGGCGSAVRAAMRQSESEMQLRDA